MATRDKNGNRLDNRIENLEIMTRGEHTSHHNKINYPKGSYLGINQGRGD